MASSFGYSICFFGIMVCSVIPPVLEAVSFGNAFATDDIHKNDVSHSTEFSYGCSMHFCHVIDEI